MTFTPVTINVYLDRYFLENGVEHELTKMIRYYIADGFDEDANINFRDIQKVEARAGFSVEMFPSNKEQAALVLAIIANTALNYIKLKETKSQEAPRQKINSVIVYVDPQIADLDEENNKIITEFARDILDRRYGREISVSLVEARHASNVGDVAINNSLTHPEVAKIKKLMRRGLSRALGIIKNAEYDAWLASAEPEPETPETIINIISCGTEGDVKMTTHLVGEDHQPHRIRRQPHLKFLAQALAIAEQTKTKKSIVMTFVNGIDVDNSNAYLKELLKDRGEYFGQ